MNTTERVVSMARPIVLSNGELHVGLNKYGLVHDFYFPYVGLENHSAGQEMRHRVGIWVEGEISWLDSDNSWSFEFSYPHSALIGHTVATNSRLGIILEFDDCVDAQISAFLRNIHVINMRDTERDVRLFMHQAFAIGDSRSNTDTGQYLPDSDAILHYRGRRAFIISGLYNDQPFDQHTIGLFGIEGHEGTYRDADDGELSNGAVEHGRVDSTLRFRMQIPPHSSTRVQYWIAAGRSTRLALFVHKQIRESGVISRIGETANWWHNWLKPAQATANQIPEIYRKTFIESVMIIKSQIDMRGAVIASTDTTMLNYSRDAYAYCWPRDGSFVLWPLIRMGYKDEAYRFFEFCKRGLHPDGYLMHKYRADGALGSSWHPYVHDGVVAPPIQEDETALVLFVFAQYYKMHPDNNLLKDFYEEMITPMADFLASYIEEATGLPKPSYDLWEQVFLTTTFTTSVVYAALLAASEIAEKANDPDNAVKWRSSAEDIASAAHKHLYNTDRKHFYKGLIVKDGEIIKDGTIDTSSTFGVFMFGLFDVSSTELTSSVETIKELFGVNQGAIGLPRYENDDYRRSNPSITGNSWFITSMWLAQYETDIGNQSRAFEILEWVRSHAMSTGMMSEQIDPVTDQNIAPAPLTWTQAEYVSTLLDTITEED
ncbi:MAG: putative Glycoside hydrolase 15-related protein [Candidatus Saccharibacteria bacterium]|nr:putative Glycoside hydrolase 15-related protein [Candidatus Saccharibacteria bacterium]